MIKTEVQRRSRRRTIVCPRVLKLPAIRDKLAAQGIDVAGGTPEEFAARMRADLATYTRVIKATGIRAE